MAPRDLGWFASAPRDVARLCMQGECDKGSCKSALLLPVLGTAETADTWGVATSVIATTAAFLVALRLTRRS